jgi:hypothetical protein
MSIRFAEVSRRPLQVLWSNRAAVGASDRTLHRGSCPLPPHSSRSAERLGLDERQQIGVDYVGMCGRHAMRKSGVGFERPVLQELDRLRSGDGERADLIIFTMHHQDRDIDHLKIVVRSMVRAAHDNCSTRRIHHGSRHTESAWTHRRSSRWRI